MKKFVIAALLVLASTIGFRMVATPTAVYAQDAKDAVCEALGAASSGDECEDPAGSSTISSVIRTALNILSVVAGLIAVIMIVIGGLKFITSGGDAQSTSSARNTIIYAAVGLIIVALSQIIVRFVINEVTTEPQTTTTTPTSRRGGVQP